MLRIINKLIEMESKRNPVLVISLGYLVIAVMGTILLSIPYVQKIPVKLIDNLFIATSALSTTGLITVSVSDSYNVIGQIIVALLIQIGGLGYMTLGSFLLLMGDKNIPMIHRRLIKGEFGFVEGFDLNTFIFSVVVFALVIEFFGALSLFFVFFSNGMPNPVWNAIFHSISSFCTAGFGLLNNSFENYLHNHWLNLIISVESMLGAMGFIVMMDFWKSLMKRKYHVTFTTKVILAFTLISISVGSILIFITEPKVQILPYPERVLASLFQAMTASTTVGFNTLPIPQLSHGVLFLLLVLMVTGASPAGTGGGIKSTTITAVYAQIIATLKGNKDVSFMKRIIPEYRLRIANAGFGFYIIFLCLGIYLLMLTEKSDFFEIFFEAASALGTVGLSMGITSGLSFLGKLIVTSLMFAGRIGPLSLGISFLFTKKGVTMFMIEEDLIM